MVGSHLGMSSALKVEFLSRGNPGIQEGMNGSTEIFNPRIIASKKKMMSTALREAETIKCFHQALVRKR